MLKLIVLSYLIEMVLGAAYPDQHCYICEQNACLYPSSQDIKVCSDSGNAGADTSGKNFVNGALNKNDSARIYDSLAAELETFGTATLGLNSNAMPKWPSLTRWVGYGAHWHCCMSDVLGLLCLQRQTSRLSDHGQRLV